MRWVRLTFNKIADKPRKAEIKKTSNPRKEEKIRIISARKVRMNIERSL